MSAVAIRRGWCPGALRPMPTGDGPRYYERVRVAGFFMKSWAYPAARADERTGATRPTTQLAPLLIGDEPVWYASQTLSRSTLAGAIGAGVFVLVVLAVWVALWRSARRERELRAQAVAQNVTIEIGEPQ